MALLEGGADPSVRAHDGSTVAHVLGAGSEDIARLLARDYPELLSVQNQKVGDRRQGGGGGRGGRFLPCV